MINKKLKKLWFATIAAAAVCGAGMSWQAGAVSVLKITDGITAASVTISDGGVGDGSVAAGAVSFNGSVGSWIVNVVTGLSYPLIGSPSNPIMDLNSVNVSGGGAGTLTIEFTQFGFDAIPSGAAFSAGIGGTTSGSVTYEVYEDASLIGSGGPYTGGAFNEFSGGFTGTGSFGSPFSLTQVVNVTHSSNVQVSSFDATLSVPDGGTTLLLLGLGMTGLVFVRRRLVSAQA